MNYYFEDFTEGKYRQLLNLAKKNYMFISFDDYRNMGKVCLLRHDIDMSVHRAYRLAQIEAEESIYATYFVHLHSRFYNPLESENFELLLDICKMGHSLGLHFDPGFYGSKLINEDVLINFLNFEKQILERMFEVKIKAFSWHDGDVGNWPRVDDNEIAGMVNAYGQYIVKNYGYCSDSNGYWRFRRLHDVLKIAEEEKLHVLTHPEWWVPSPMTPRERVARCVEGRAFRTLDRYDKLLKEIGRENVK